jgi:hypothetical protein
MQGGRLGVSFLCTGGSGGLFPSRREIRFVKNGSLCCVEQGGLCSSLQGKRLGSTDAGCTSRGRLPRSTVW